MLLDGETSGVVNKRGANGETTRWDRLIGCELHGGDLRSGPRKLTLTVMVLMDSRPRMGGGSHCHAQALAQGC